MTAAVSGQFRATARSALLTLIIVSSSAQGVTLDNLRDARLDPIFGRYAPAGNCAAYPIVTIDKTGIAFRTTAGTTHTGSFEYAVSYMGPEYEGITSVFFPFPVSDDDFGRLLMFVNADEKKGRLTFEADLGPGQRQSQLEAMLTRSSPLMLCKPAAKPASR